VSGGDRPPICAVTVTHHPDPGWPRRFDALAAEVPRAVIVDNNSNEDELEMLAEGARRHGAHLVRNDRNLGFAAALNQGARWAFGEGYRWLLLLDQDSEPERGIGEELLRVFELASSRSATAVVGANFFDEARERLRFAPRSRAADGWTPVQTVIASGSLVECDAYQAVGPFREEFFVDSVDHDFCLRARAKGYRVVVAMRPLIKHRIGATTARRVWGMRVVATNHSAERRYLMGRNRLVLAKEHLFHEPRWVAASLFALLLETAALLLVEADRGRKVRSLLHGVWHGVRGRLDRQPEIEGA
jgi:rhamnosyltransferase